MGMLSLLWGLGILLSGCGGRTDSPPAGAPIVSEPACEQTGFPAADEAVTEIFAPDESEQIVYGTSGSGKYDLTAYRFGQGENVLLLTFCVHGWDDGCHRDGLYLMQAAEYVMQRLSGQEYPDWSVYVIPCVNPDGLFDGISCNGAGRCTTFVLEDGKSVYDEGRGIDINRSFPYRFAPQIDSRNYNGTKPLQCVEAAALADFARNIMGTGSNVCIDIHGWDCDLFVSRPEGSVLNDVLDTCFEECTERTDTEGRIYHAPQSLENGSGYFSAWCGYELGYDSALLELPKVLLEQELKPNPEQPSGERLNERIWDAVALLLRQYE